MDSEFIKSALEQIRWNGISIQTDPDGKNALILICETKNNADIFYNLLENIKYKITKRFYSDTGIYGLLISFIGTEYAIGCDTKKTLENYPPIKLLIDGLVDYMTTGTFFRYTENGDAEYLYNKPCALFDKIHLN